MTFRNTELALYEHSALASSQSRSYPSDSESDPFLARNSLTNWPRVSNAAIRLQDPLLKCDRNLGWNIDWAVAFLVDRLEANWSDAAENLKNMRLRAAALERGGLMQDIPFRIFSKLDETIFAGHLKGAVFLKFHSLGSDVSGATYTHSWGPNTEVRRISIVLNTDVLAHARARDIVATLLHHMIHAYFLIACGPQKEDEVEYGRLGHGVHFGKIMSMIRKLSAVHGPELTPLGFGYNAAEIRYFADEYCYHRDRVEVDREDKEKWYCSHCHSNIEVISESDIDKWYSKVCKPMFDQPRIVRSAETHFYNDRHHEIEKKSRTRLMPSAKSVEFIFKDKLVFVDAKKVDNLLGVRVAFEKAKSRYLKIHKDVSEATFLHFLEFLHTGSYRPDPTALAAFSASLGAGRKGPPVIKPVASSSQTALLADVRFAKLSALMGFKECNAYALSRMNACSLLYEDPVAVLKEIYSGSEPDTDLKAWARKFLVQAPATSLPNYYIPSSLTLGTVEPPNLIKLESEQGSHRARFLDAVEASGTLENDVNKARAELKTAGWYSSWSSVLPQSPQSLLLDRAATCPSNLLTLSLPHPLPLLNDTSLPSSLTPFLTPSLSPSPSLWTNLQNLNLNLTPTNMSTLELTALRDLKDLKDLKALKDRERLRDLDALKHDQLLRDFGSLTHVEKVRELERESRMIRELERRRDREKEELVRGLGAAMLQQFFGGSGGRGVGGEKLKR